MVKPAAKTATQRFLRRAIASPLLCGLLAFSLAQPAQAEPPAKGGPRSDAQVKAVLLAKFLHYIQWPEQALPKPGAPISIGFLGSDPVATEMSGLVSGGTYIVKGRPLALKRSARPTDLLDCQVLFISKSANANVKAVLATFQGTGVLTVSDLDRFSAAGGMIAFRNDGDRIRFEINHAAARREGLQISADLCAFADKMK